MWDLNKDFFFCQPNVKAPPRTYSITTVASNLVPPPPPTSPLPTPPTTNNEDIDLQQKETAQPNSNTHQSTQWTRKSY
jgi:hypothetical protein